MTNFKKRFGWLVVLSSASYLLSFASQLLISYHFGTSAYLDGYWVAFSIVNLFCFYVGPFKEALVPINHRSMDAHKSGEVLSAAFLLLISLATLAAIIMVSCQDKLISLISGNSFIDENNITSFLYLFLPSFWLLGLSETINALLTCHNKVIFQTVTRLLGSLAMIGCLILFGGELGVKSLIIGVLTSQLIVLVFSSMTLRSIGIKLTKPNFSIFFSGQFPRLFCSLLLTYFIAQCYTAYERSVMLSMTAGTIASFQYGVTLTNVIISIIAYPLANLLWPQFLKNDAEQNIQEAVHTTLKATATLYTGLLAICFFSYSHAYEIISIIYGHGAFDENSIILTANTFRAAVFTAIPIGLFSIFGRLLISTGASTPFATVGFIIAVTGICVLAFSKYSGKNEIALYHWLLSNLTGTLVCIFLFFKKFKVNRFNLLSWTIWMIKTTTIVFFTGIIVNNIKLGLILTNNLLLILADVCLYTIALCAGLHLLKLVDIHKPIIALKP